jgi:stalled ribosome rescue protein Dom34
MDHSSAHCLDLKDESIETKIIESEFTREVRKETLGKSESIMHHKENQMHHDYYKTIGESLRNYDAVVLFGPSNAKDELFNMLKEDHGFSSTRIEVKDSDYMSKNEEHAFVKDYFKKLLV